jgi:hypothetical protein
MKKGMPEQERVTALYSRIGGALGETAGTARHYVQQIVYVEDACRNVLDVIARMNQVGDLDAPSAEKPDALIQELRGELTFLRALMNDKAFIGSLPNR